MPLHVRSIAVSLSVICFFGLSSIGWISGLTPFVCCKRALIGAVLVYIAGTWAVRAINAALMNAMISNQMTRQEGLDFTTGRKIGPEEKSGAGKD